MKKILFLLTTLVCLSFSQSYSQVQLQSLQRHLSVLAHDSLEGRGIGTPGIEKAAQYIENQFKQLGLLPYREASYRQTFKAPGQKIVTSNVIGMIEGTTEKDQYVVISAHYDHLGIQYGQIYNGADDDGSGTAALIAMAEAIQEKVKMGQRPRKSIVFIAFSAEESGLLGSSFYTKNTFLHLSQTTCDLNIDMIGRIDETRTTPDKSNYVYVIGHDKVSSEWETLLAKVNRNNPLVLDYKFDLPDDPERIFYRSDHYNFARFGVPILFFYDGMLGDDYHKPSDDIERINWDLYVKRANFIYSLALEVANLDHKVLRDKPLD